MKFLLTSAGINNDAIADELARLAGRALSELNVAFIITASIIEGDDKGWLIDNMADMKSRNFKSIDILDVSSLPESKWQERLSESDVICVGGGNEIYLEEVFVRIGMRDYLLGTLKNNYNNHTYQNEIHSDAEDISKSKVYVGISAGSMAAGINLPERPYRELFMSIEDYGLPTVPAMELVNITFVPHLNSEYFKYRLETLEKLEDHFVNDIYAVDDNTAISIEDDNIRVIGGGTHYIYKPQSA